MQLITPNIADNPRGANPLTGIYKAINAKYPTYGLTVTNSVVLSTQPAVSTEYPLLKRILIEKNKDPSLQYEFFYSCLDITSQLPKPVFNAAQVAYIKANIKTSADLVNYMATTFNKNFRPEDFWTSDNSIDFCGGTKTPNFYLKTLYSAQWFIGEMVLNLWT